MHATSSGAVAPTRHGLAVVMRDHHARLQHCCRQLLSTAYTDDARELIERWRALEDELAEHMDSEEDVILPAYTLHHPGDAAAIRAAHDRIRELVVAVGVAIELHEVRAAELRRLVEALENHALHEDMGMYLWAQTHLPEVVQRALIQRWWLK